MRTADGARHAYRGVAPTATLLRRSRAFVVAMAAACALALLLAAARGELPTAQPVPAEGAQPLPAAEQR